MTPTGGDAPDRSFLEGILRLFEDFRRIHPTPDALMVEMTFAHAGTYYFRGLQIDSAEDIPGCVMVRGTDSPPTEAVVVRVEDVLRAVFYPPPPDPAPLGFPG
jgi:hypothetical protein